MFTQRLTACILAVLLGCMGSAAWGTTYYVDAGGSDNDDGLSWETAFATIQKGLDTAGNGDTVIVDEGTYYEAVGFDGKSITLTSTDPEDSGVVANTIIDANGANYAATFNSGEGSDSVITGFTLKGNYGGAYCYNTSPTISNCLVTNSYYYGIVCFGYTATPVITNCHVDNSSYYGILLYCTGGTVRNCIIENCSYGIYAYCNDSPLTIENNYIRDNTRGIYVYYTYSATPAIRNNWIYDNSTAGIETYSSNSPGVFTNNTMVGNYYGIYVSSGTAPTVRNCIVWGSYDDLYNCSATYSCIEDGDYGTGNISSNPLFVDAPNDDYHLSSSSPCIDVGYSSETYTGQLDIDFEGRVIDIPGKGDGTVDVDMGADEVADKVQNKTKGIWYCGIQTAINYASEGDVIEVKQGTYVETINFYGKSITLQSTDAGDADVVAATIIDPDCDASNTGRVVTFNNNEDANSILKGFTITGGYAPGGGIDRDGAGILCYSSSPTISNCVITGNYCGDDGGGIFLDEGSDAAISDCTISNNESGDKGGGLYCRGSIPILSNCIFLENEAGTDGGGFHSTTSTAKINACIFIGNFSEDDGGGVYSQDNSPTITNCLVAENTATDKGGGFYSRDNTPVITNCTVYANSAVRGGGIYNSNANAVVTNCILWDDTASDTGNEIYNATSSPVVTYCDVEGGWSGTGNINDDPDFEDGDTIAGPDGVLRTSDDGLRLKLGSPCVDVGDPNIDTDDVGPVDLIGEVRIMDGDYDGNEAMDMGAYERDPIWHVDKDAPGPTHDGHSWATAFTTLQAALDAAGNDDEDQIWVAEGTYKPSERYFTYYPNSVTFDLADAVGVEIYGGFGGYQDGDETSTAQRDWVRHETILSGDIDNDGVLDGDNCYWVVRGAGVSTGANPTVLDGFTITMGWDIGWDGAGMRNENCSPTVRNCLFKNNKSEGGDGDGGGMHNYNSSPTVINCVFTDNIAGDDGGGLSNRKGSNGTFINCVFVNNCVEGDNDGKSNGGGIWNTAGEESVPVGSSPTFINCVIANNTTVSASGGRDGGGVANKGVDTEPEFINCTFTGNTAAQEGGAFASKDGADAIVTNCIFWDNYAPTDPEIYNDDNGSSTTVSYSCVEGGYPGGTNIGGDPADDPSFVNADNICGPDSVFGTADDGLAISFDNSPCIDIGSNSALPSDTYNLDGDSDTDEKIPVDVIMNKRQSGSVSDPDVDMGAYEAMPTFAHWKLDGDATDSSGNARHGTVSGTTTNSDGGIYGDALEFDGNDDRVTVTDNDFDGITEAISLSAWLTADIFNLASAETIMGKGSAWELYRDATAETVYFSCSVGGSIETVIGSTNVNDGLWHHVVGVYDGANLRLYVDGVEDNFAPASGAINAGTADVYIGCQGGTGRYWEGMIDDVRVYDYAMDAELVQAAKLFEEAGYWRFAVAADSQGSTATPGVNYTVLNQIAGEMLSRKAEVALFPGDLVHGDDGDPGQSQLEAWRYGYNDGVTQYDLASQLYDGGVEVMPLRGNHDCRTANITYAHWDAVFGGSIPENGPANEEHVTYYVAHRNALFIALDQFDGANDTYPYNLVNLDWLDSVLAENTWLTSGDNVKRHVFVSGHEAAFEIHHDSTMADAPGERDILWNRLQGEPGCRMYFHGHSHFYHHGRISDDADPSDDVHQMTVGTISGNATGGNWADDTGRWIPVDVFHDDNNGPGDDGAGDGHGYLLVELWGDSHVRSHWIGRNGTAYEPCGDVFAYTVPEDEDAPEIESVAAVNKNTVVVQFNELVEEVSAETVSHYSIKDPAQNPVSISSAVLSVNDKARVILTTATLTDSTIYTIEVDDVADRSAVAVNWANDDEQFTFNAPANYTFSVMQVGENGDVEENAGNGVVNRGSSDLELAYDNHNQIVGIRFDNVYVPNGVTLTSAYIQFSVDNDDTCSSGNPTLTIMAEQSDNASPFHYQLVNDVSNRIDAGSQSATWSNIAAWTTHLDRTNAQRTIDINSVISEITDRSGWQSGNSIVILINGSDSGYRTAESGGDDADDAPELCLNW